MATLGHSRPSPATVVANFGAPDGSEGFLSLETVSGGTEVGTSWVRVYHGSPVTYRVVNGSVVSTQTGLYIEVSEYVVMASAKSATVSKPLPTDLKFSTVGPVIGRAPTWNGVEFVSSVDTTCVISVSYKAPSSMVEIGFTPCPATKPVEEPAGSTKVTLPERPPAILLASITAMVSGVSTTKVESVTLPPPACKYPTTSGTYVDFSSGVTYPSLVLDVHPEFPPQYGGTFSGNIGGPKSNLTTWCALRVFTSTSVTVSSTSGRSIFVASLSGILSVQAPMPFSGGGSSNLQYVPNGSVSVAASGVFLDQDGNSFSPGFALPGQSVKIRVWTGPKTYREEPPRALGPTEIMVTNNGYAVTKCFGMAIVSYTASYNTYYFEFDDPDSALVTPPVTVMAITSSQVAGTVTITPPSRRGMK